MKEIKVWETIEGNHVYLCEGAGHDDCYTVWESRLLLNKGESLPNDRAQVYKAHGNLNASSWFTSEKAAMEAFNRTYSEPLDWIEIALFHTDIVEPLPKVFMVEFDRSRDGRLFTRVNRHPERDGARALPSKMFFPDRTFDADIGYAEVSISMEKETYGFLTGRMLPFGDVELERVLDFLWKDQADPDTQVLCIDAPNRGKYKVVREYGRNCIIGSKTYADYRIFEDEHGVRKSCDPAVCIAEDCDKYITNASTFGELIVDDMIKNDSCEFWHSPLPQSEFFENERFKYRWFSIPYDDDDIIQDAIDTGILKKFYLNDLPKIRIFVIDSDKLYLLAGFEPEERQHIFDFVRDINLNADVAIKQKIKNGKIRI